MFTVWNNIETVEVQYIAHTAVADLFPADPPGFLCRTPCGYHDVDMIRTDLAQAGIDNATVETLEIVSPIESARHAAIGFVRGTPLSGEIAAVTPTDWIVPSTRWRMPSRELRHGPIKARMQAHVVTARR